MLLMLNGKPCETDSLVNISSLKSSLRGALASPQMGEFTTM